MRLKSLIVIIGLVLLFVPIILPAPTGMTGVAWRASGLALAMAIWWLTEAMPLPATALLPLAAAPLLELAEIGHIATSYSNPIIILFLGGFLLAKAIEKSGLHKRLAGILLKRAGTSPHRVLGAVMLSTAFLSLWISNTASAMVVAPIAAAIAGSQSDRSGFATALMLGVAFSATIGGMGSLIGTPPNAIFAAYVNATYGLTVGFAQWAAIGIPIALLLLIVAWLVLAWITPRPAKAALSLTFGHHKTPMQADERRVALVAGMTALAWFSRPLIEGLLPTLPISDAGIAIFAALALFMMSDGGDGKLLDWETAASLRWDVLILFGGGLALADIIQGSGLADWIGGSVHAVSHLPEFAVLLMIGALIVYVGELASNTAMAAIFLPIAGAVAVELGTDPVAFMLPVALAASIGFMLPVATPPNAIVFASPAVTRLDLMRAGAPLDLVALVITVGVSSFLSPIFFG